MAYATIDDLVMRFGEYEIIQISDRNRDGEIDQAIVMTALNDATAEINSYLGRYRLPFLHVPQILSRLCCDIARYRLHGAGTATMSEDIERRYKIDVLKILERLANGEITLGVEDDGQQVDTGDTVRFVNNGNRIFSRDNEIRECDSRAFATGSWLDGCGSQKL